MNKSAEELLARIAALENAAKRGLRLNEEIKPHLTQGHIVSVEYCNATLKHCALFRRWINECLGS